ncbi:RICIN domain-containing protein [Fulvivirga ligni]|uniref:RICIN domain-containing protein n=1 Tax=Fulvivirga ligni TaxID=2904246 RepID=UPI001F367A3C|nr:RICIN domain-containing protein [Fulvivirga ligni]UII18981.1 RICIN domain-containing protein [Fulvivirga ligni]
MKYFKRKACIFGMFIWSMTTTSIAQNNPATEDLSPFYQHFYQITSSDTTHALTRSKDRSDDNRFNIFEGTYSNKNDRQHWLIMPSSPDSEEFTLVEIHKGLVADIFTNGNLASRFEFTGEANQTFQFTELPNGKVRIQSPLDRSLALTRLSNKNVIFSDLNSTKQQDFALIQKDTFPNNFKNIFHRLM